jgi:hypothetical protein
LFDFATAASAVFVRNDTESNFKLRELETQMARCAARWGMGELRALSEVEPTAKTDTLQRLAAEALIVAETTVDPARKRALRVLALGYARLADFVRAKADATGENANTPRI